MVDDLVGCGGAPLAEVFGGVGIADKRRVVASDDRSVECGPDTGVGVRPGDDQAPYLALSKHGLEVGVLEGVAVPLVDYRLSLFLSELGNVEPAVAAFSLGANASNFPALWI